jgi:hypothetical protein
MEYILTYLFYLKQIICVSYRIKEEQHIDTIKNDNYNSTSLETDKNYNLSNNQSLSPYGQMN